MTTERPVLIDGERYLGSERMVPGACATEDEWEVWLHGGPGPRGRVNLRTYCLDGDDEGCAMMRRLGRCPHTRETVAQVSEVREWRQVKADAM